MDVKYLTYVLEMANQKSITKAANALYISQPSLSQYLSKLEGELGTPLFVRTKNELLPTPAGELYIAAAKEVIEIQKQLYSNIATLSQTGQIRVGLTSKWAMDVLSDIMPLFQERYPLVTVKIYQNKYDNMVQFLNSGKIDLAVMAAPNEELDSFNYPYEVLRQEELVFAISKKHPLNKEMSIEKNYTMAEISEMFKKESFVLSDNGSSIRIMTDQIFRKHHFTPFCCCDVNSNRVQLELVSKGMGVCFIPVSYANPDIGIEYYHMGPTISRANLVVFRTSGNSSEIERYFADLVKSHKYFQK